MIRLTKYLYVNILTIIMFVCCFVSHSLGILCITYAVMIIHELAHTLAAICIGLKISHICFYPFGVNLKLKNKMVYSLADEIILYASGPLCNIVLALVAVMLYRQCPNENLRFFYISNIMLFLMNMLPAIPLDGGIILKKILMYKMGSEKAVKYMKYISIVVSMGILMIGVYVMYVTRFNFSVLLFSVLVIGNVFTQREKYNIDFVKELMFYKKKNKGKIKHLITDEKIDYRRIAEKFTQKDYSVVYIVNDVGEIKEILTETQIIDKITND